MTGVNAGNEHDAAAPDQPERNPVDSAAAAGAGANERSGPPVEESAGQPVGESAEQAREATSPPALADLADLDDAWDGSLEINEPDEDEDAKPLEELVDSSDGAEELEKQWYILKVQVNRENSICEALGRQVKKEGMDRYFEDILVPTEDVREYTKSGKQKIVKRKLYPGYVVVRMFVNEDSWQLVRGTPGIGDFTGAAGKPVPLSEEEVARIISTTRPEAREGIEETARTAIKFKSGDRVRVKEGYFQNHEGEVSNIDERNGRVTVMINIFGRPNPVELDHWQIESM